MLILHCFQVFQAKTGVLDYIHHFLGEERLLSDLSEIEMLEQSALRLRGD